MLMAMWKERTRYERALLERVNIGAYFIDDSVYDVGRDRVDGEHHRRLI